MAYQGIAHIMRGRLGMEERELVSNALADAVLADWKRRQSKFKKMKMLIVTDMVEREFRMELRRFATDLAISSSGNGDTKPEDGPVVGWRHEFAAELQNMAKNQKNKNPAVWEPVIGEDLKVWSSRAIYAFEARLRDSARGCLILDGLDRGDFWAVQVAIAEAMRSIKQTLIGIAGSLAIVAGGVALAVRFLFN
jgi:hypothetical protein